MSTPERQQDAGEHGYGGVQQEKSPVEGEPEPASAEHDGAAPSADAPNGAPEPAPHDRRSVS